MNWLPFKSLKWRITFLFCGLAFIVLSAIFLTTNHYHNLLVHKQASRELDVGTNALKHILNSRWDQLALAAKMLTSDFAFKQAIGTQDYATIYTALKNSKIRIGSHRTMILSLDGEVISDVENPSLANTNFKFPELIDEADENGQAAEIISFEDKFFQFVVVPLKAPLTIAWVALAFEVQPAELQSLSDLTRLDLIVGKENSPQHINNLSTLEKKITSFLIKNTQRQDLKSLATLKTENGLKMVAKKVMISGSKKTSKSGISFVLLKPLNSSILSDLQSKASFFSIFIIGFLLFFSLSIVVAKSISSPISSLTQAALKFSKGEWEAKASYTSPDELGKLSRTFNKMALQLKNQFYKIEQNSRQLEDINKKIEIKYFETALLLDISNSINQFEDQDEILSDMLEKILLAFKFDRGSIIKLNPETNKLDLRVSHQRFGELSKVLNLEQIEQDSSYCSFKEAQIAGHVIKNGDPLLLLNKDSKEYQQFKGLEGADLESITCVPIKRQQEIVGAITLVQETGKSTLKSENITFLNTVSNHISMVLQNTELSEEAVTDGMTQLFNKKHFTQHLEKSIKCSDLQNENFSLILFDIDHFKKFNDNHGHLLGDKVLIEVAQVFKSTGRESDFHARYGGEEFVMVLRKASLDKACQIAEDLRKKIAAHLVESEDGNLNVTISLGVAEYPKHASSAAELIKAADIALYAAKQAGRNNVQKAKIIKESNSNLISLQNKKAS